MTVIVANHEMIVADSRVTDEKVVGDVRIFSSPKIFEKNGDLIGCAGDSINCEDFLKWYGSRKKKPVFKADFAAVVLTKKGELYYFDEKCARDRISDDYIAIGSGGHAALGALHMGADPVRAVEIACKVDINCGLPVQVIKLTPPSSS